MLTKAKTDSKMYINPGLTHPYLEKPVPGFMRGLTSV